MRRSQWPNLAPERLVELTCRWAEAKSLRAVIIFDGRAPAVHLERGCELVETGSETADDWIVRAVSDDSDYWLVTSDRELRARAGGRAQRLIGGGAFLRELTDSG